MKSDIWRISAIFYVSLTKKKCIFKWLRLALPLGTL